jgi:AraC-like DNA-binding protein
MTMSVSTDWLHHLVNEAQWVDEATLGDTRSAPTLHAIERRLTRALIPLSPLEDLMVRSVAAKAYVETLALRRRVASASSHQHHGPAHAVLALVRAEFSAPLTLAAIGRRLGCHPSTLNRLFRREFGQSIAAHVAQLRLAEGIRRLRVDADKIESIAEAVGYRSKRAFYRAVRRQTGLTPGQLRTTSS